MRVLIILGLFLLNGCISWIGHSDSKHLKSAHYTSYQQINFIEVASDNEIAFSITKDNPTFNFQQGISFFYALELTGTNRQFLLRSYFSDTKMRRFASPVLLELDDELKVLSQNEPLLSFSHLPRYEVPHMHGLISLNEQTKYLIVYPSNDEQTTRTRTMRYAGQTTGDHIIGRTYFPGYTLKHPLTKTITGKIEMIPAVFSQPS